MISEGHKNELAVMTYQDQHDIMLANYAEGIDAVIKVFADKTVDGFSGVDLIRYCARNALIHVTAIYAESRQNGTEDKCLDVTLMSAFVNIFVWSEFWFNKTLIAIEENRLAFSRCWPTGENKTCFYIAGTSSLSSIINFTSHFHETLQRSLSKFAQENGLNNYKDLAIYPYVDKSLLQWAELELIDYTDFLPHNDWPGWKIAKESSRVHSNVLIEYSQAKESWKSLNKESTSRCQKINQEANTSKTNERTKSASIGEAQEMVRKILMDLPDKKWSCQNLSDEILERYKVKCSKSSVNNTPAYKTYAKAKKVYRTPGRMGKEVDLTPRVTLNTKVADTELQAAMNGDTLESLIKEQQYEMAKDERMAKQKIKPEDV